MSGTYDSSEDTVLRDILTATRTIAVVGASADPRRPSFGVMGFLRRSGYQVFGVNPGLAADAIEGITIYPSLAAIPVPVDMVDIFRNSDAVGGVIDEVLAMQPRPKVVWMQLGVRNDEAATRAEAAGLRVVMDRCPAIEAPRLGLIIGRGTRSPASR